MGAQLYDTNVLIESMRGGVSKLDGSTTSLNLIEFPKGATIEGLKVIVPGKGDFDTAYRMAVLLLKEGTPVPAVDVVIAAVALNRNLTLCTADRHFEAIRKINNTLLISFV